ncbi:hypothetical protein CC78DRAFT_618101 [Lojkania enalia]|uniref:Uncharacterized protein n=1 Tax=Lojkania enalia TaxID=147567 RepID=A0A9P4KA85_9PLEO|nr:hypothetical protein CC78DRAFT_618101 [Didymosphaeria enalia]
MRPACFIASGRMHLCPPLRSLYTNCVACTDSHSSMAPTHPSIALQHPASHPAIYPPTILPAPALPSLSLSSASLCTLVHSSKYIYIYIYICNVVPRRETVDTTLAHAWSTCLLPKILVGRVLSIGRIQQSPWTRPGILGMKEQNLLLGEDFCCARDLCPMKTIFGSRREGKKIRCRCGARRATVLMNFMKQRRI